MKRLRYTFLGACAAALVFVTTTTAGSGIGGVFNLGQTNTVNASSVLTGTPPSATSMLNVKNGSALSGSFGVLGQLTSSSSTAKSAGVRGIGLGQAAGVWGTGTSGPGVYGSHPGTSGGSPGVLGETKSTTGAAVGVYGRVTSATAGAYSSGVRGDNAGTGADQYGVYGTVGGNGIGVSGFSPGGNGVKGVSSLDWGVYGQTANGGRFGVFGYNPIASGTAGGGVYGSSPNGVGTYGSSVNSVGVHGYSTYGSGVLGESSSGPGIYGYSGGGSAAYFEGDVTVSGTLYAGAKQFRIDDPLDPAHKYLQHTSVESSDMLDIYEGNATTDARGFATVRLPRWFQALNRSFRYQLTSLSGLQEVAVAKEIAHDRFTIQSEKPHSKVSWQVTGTRHDPFANAHRTPVVAPKAAADKGRYVDPQLYGKPRSDSIAFQASPRGGRER